MSAVQLPHDYAVNHSTGIARHSDTAHWIYGDVWTMRPEAGTSCEIEMESTAAVSSASLK